MLRRSLGRDARRASRAWREERRREKQRQEVHRRSTRRRQPKDAGRAKPRIADAPRRAGAIAAAARRRDRDDREPRRRGRAEEAVAHRRDGRRRRRRAEGGFVAADAAAGRSSARRRRSRRRCRCRSRDKAPAERRKGAYTLPPLALLDAPKTERKIDERELMDGARLLEEKCREFSVEGTVVQIHPGPGRHDLRVQAGRRREVQQDHRPRRRPLPGDAGRVGADRSHPRQVDRRHPDSEPEPRADLAARAARVGGLPALGVEADAGARQDHPRRAVRQPTSRRCRTC